MARRTLNPFVAALIGILMIPASVCLHAWNEYRTVHRARGLQEAVEIVESIPDSNQLESSTLVGDVAMMCGDHIFRFTHRQSNQNGRNKQASAQHFLY